MIRAFPNLRPCSMSALLALLDRRLERLFSILEKGTLEGRKRASGG